MITISCYEVSSSSKYIIQGVISFICYYLLNEFNQDHEYFKSYVIKHEGCRISLHPLMFLNQVIQLVKLLKNQIGSRKEALFMY